MHHLGKGQESVEGKAATVTGKVVPVGVVVVIVVAVVVVAAVVVAVVVVAAVVGSCCCGRLWLLWQVVVVCGSCTVVAKT